MDSIREWRQLTLGLATVTGGLRRRPRYGISFLPHSQNMTFAASATAAININTTGDDGIIVFMNSTTGFAQVAYDADTDDVTSSSNDAANVIFGLENITTLTDLAAAFSADSFVI